MVDTQLNGHRTGESSRVSVQPVGDPQRQHKGRPSPLQRRKQRLTQQLQGVPIISRSVGHGLTHWQPPVLPFPLRTGRPFAPPPAAIEMIDLCKTFGAFRAVDHLSLVVQQGEVFGLLGPNGSGKTTTINLICGLSDPTSGGIQVMGYDIPRQKRHMYQILGVVHQETALYDELSAWDNMMFHAKLYGVPAAAREQGDSVAPANDPSG